jgi:hypothetical protein
VRRFVLALTRTVALYAFAAWSYVALVAVFLPKTLGFQLTHFSKLPHTDTFGEVSFVVSLASYFVYRMLIEAQPPAAGMTERPVPLGAGRQPVPETPEAVAGSTESAAPIA